MRKILYWLFGGLTGLTLAVFGMQMIASETAEVVVLHTDGDAGVESTRLWVVDHEGTQYLRAGGEFSGWYARLVGNAEVTVVRGAVPAQYTAVARADLRDVINSLMRQKYGWRDSYISMLFGRAEAIPVKLEPSG